MDFSPAKYKELLLALRSAGYSFLTMEDYAGQEKNASDKVCILRHDVDRRPDHSLRIAEMEHSLGIRAVYYFRIVPDSCRPDIIRAIAALGHEIGYHYEDLSLCDGDADKAFEQFKEHLAFFRQYYPVRTICMHGAPASRYDGRGLWKQHDYRSLGIICEPYLDLDYSRLFYLTDTGRRWDGYRVSLRDRIPVWQEQWIRLGLVFHSTDDILRALRNPDSVLLTRRALLITTHPQRWTDNRSEWLREYCLQSAKNVVKGMLVVLRRKKVS